MWAGDQEDLTGFGIPERLTNIFRFLRVPVDGIRRLHAAEVSWTLVEDLHGMRAVLRYEDLQGLLSMWFAECTPEEIRAWGRLGQLESAARLHMGGMPVTDAQRFPVAGEIGGLAHLLRLATAAKAQGIYLEDLWLWHSAGVVQLTAPYVVGPAWTLWRSVAVHHLGRRRAALAAGAGLSPEEAVRQHTEGGLDESGLEMLAGLRTT